MVVAGHDVELVEYERPYFYNLPPPHRSAPSGLAEILPVRRRDDHLDRTRATLRRIVSANSEQWGCLPLFITYTFAKNITDLKEANTIFSLYHKRVKYHLKITLKYLVVVEFQKRGAVHYHCIYFNIPFIPKLKHILADEWGQGFVDVKSIKNIRSVGAYVSKYLRKDMGDKRLNGNKSFYCSRGLIYPSLYRSEQNIDKFLKTSTLNIVSQKAILTERYGMIRYSTYHTQK